VTEKNLLKLKYFKAYHTLVNRKKKSPYNQGILKLNVSWWQTGGTFKVIFNLI